MTVRYFTIRCFEIVRCRSEWRVESEDCERRCKEYSSVTQQTSPKRIELYIYTYTMPQQSLPSGQDWNPVNAGRATSSGGGLKAVPKTAQELSLAKARGLVTTEKRMGAGGNQSAHSGGVLSARKLEEADDVGTIAKVDKSLSKAIMQVRF